MDDDDPLWQVKLVLAATPIGNLGDVTERLKRLLTSAEVIACEDTRRTRHLISALQLSTPARLVSFHEHNEAARAEELVAAAAAGTRVLVVSDAGMPAVSDPGFRLVSAAVASGVEATVAPGASAVTTALALSGLDTGRFSFAGFLPRKGAERTQMMQRLAQEDWTTVFFESPHRVAATVAELNRQLGEGRRAAVARELTKKHEEVLRGTLGELADVLAERQQSAPLKGEFVVVLSGRLPQDPAEVDIAALAQQVVGRAAGGERIKAAAKEVAAAHGVSSSELYAAAVELRKKSA